jgi:hypothetical protein
VSAAGLRCRIGGHRFRFWAEQRTMRWRCERGCGAGGAKLYGSADDAARYARAFDQDDRSALGRRPTLSLLPLWLVRRARERGR